MLLETGLGAPSDSPGPIFLSKMAQLETYKRPITTVLAPIEYAAPLLQAAAIEFATHLDRSTEEILQRMSGRFENLPVIFQLQRSSQMLKYIVQNLSNSLCTAEWSQGSSTRTEQLLQEYIILSKSTKSLGQDVKDLIQQESGFLSIQETKKGLQQADSVRR